jgi:hypothetical protein
VTDIELGAFLSGPRNPEYEALLRLIGASILDRREAEADDELAARNTGREWSNVELKELGDMLVRVSVAEIARLLRRDHREVRDKVAEVGRPAVRLPTNRLRASEISEGPLGGSSGWRGWGAAASIAPGRGPPAPNPSGPLGERAMVGAPGGLRRRRLRAAWAITRMNQHKRMGASPTAPTISQDTAIQRLPPGAIASWGIDARCPKIGGAAANTSKRAGRGDRRAGSNSSPAGAAHSALLATEFGGRCLEFGEPADGSRCHYKGSGWRRRAAVSRIHLTFALYARERLQREGGKRVKIDNRLFVAPIRARRRRHRYSGL